MIRASWKLLFFVAGAALIQVAMDRWPVYVDLTERGLYTLNQASVDLVNTLEAPLEIRLYQSENLPTRLRPVAEYARHMADAYERAGKGQITVVTIDPGTTGALAEAANQLGIFRTKANVAEDNKLEVVEIWFGMAIFYRGNHEAFPSLSAVENVEYDMTSAMARLSREQSPRIRLVGPAYLNERLGFVFDIRHDLKSLARELKGLGEVSQEMIEPNGPVPDLLRADLVIAWGLPRFREDQLYALDQYIMSGKPLLLMAPGAYINAAQLSAAPIPHNRADQFYANLGFRVGRHLVGDSRAGKIRYTESSAPALKNYALYPRPLPGLPGLNPKHTATAYLQSLVVPWASPLEANPTNDVRVSMLATTSKQAWLIDDPMIIDPQRVPGPTQFDTYALGIALEGRFLAFFESPPKGFDSDKHIAQSPNDTQVLVWGSEHMLTQTQDASLKAWITHTAGFLTHRALMAGIDRRDNTIRPIRQPPSNVKERYQWLSIGFVPLLVILAATIRWFCRRSIHRRFLDNLGSNIP